MGVADPPVQNVGWLGRGGDFYELAPIGDRASICMAGTGCSIIRGVLNLPDENERHAVAEIRSYCIEPVWEQLPPLLPEKEANNPPGCHRSRIPGWIVFEKLL